MWRSLVCVAECGLLHSFNQNLVLISDTNQIISEFFCDCGTLLWHDRILVPCNDDCLCCLHYVNSILVLLSTDHILSTRQVHVLQTTNKYSICSQNFRVTNVVYNFLQLLWCGLQLGRGSPNVSIMTANYSIRHHLGSDELVVNIALPRHN